MAIRMWSLRKISARLKIYCWVVWYALPFEFYVLILLTGDARTPSFPSSTQPQNTCTREKYNFDVVRFAKEAADEEDESEVEALLMSGVVGFLLTVFYLSRLLT